MNTNSLLPKQWTSKQALILMVLCLSVGITGGWLIRGLRRPAEVAAAKPAGVPSPAPAAPSAAAPAPSPAQLKSMADSEAAPLLQKLSSDPKNPELLTSIGNLYYDAHQYPVAVDFYGRALQSKPSDAAVRTDMATAYWFPWPARPTARAALREPTRRVRTLSIPAHWEPRLSGSCI